MKTLTTLFIGLFIGAGSSYFYVTGIHQAEDTITEEIALLNQYAQMPNCDLIHQHADQIMSNQEQENKVYWYYVSKTNTLKKAIITPQLFIAYEQASADCP